MSTSLFVYVGIMLVGVFISSLSQVLLKKEAGKKHISVIQEYFNSKVIAAYALFFTATLMSIYAYKVVPLSIGPALEATGYFYITIFSVMFFKEKISVQKGIAVMCIIVGNIILMAE